MQKGGKCPINLGNTADILENLQEFLESFRTFCNPRWKLHLFMMVKNKVSAECELFNQLILFFYFSTGSKVLKKHPNTQLSHAINKCLPSYNFPHLLCSAYNLVTLFFLILLAILLQLFLFLFEFTPFRFFPFRAC